MGLTDREKQIIEQMERALASEDPRLVATMERKRPSILLNLLAIGLGITLILAGVVAKLAILGIVGFLVALAGAATIRTGRIGRFGQVGNKERKAKGGAKKGNRIQDRWDRRNQ